MTRQLTGLLAAAALVSAGAVFAQAGEPMAPKSGTTEPGKPGSQTGQMQPGMQQELTGEVVRMDENTVYLRHMGFIVPLEINTQTKFSQLQKQDLKEGREIRASFTIEGQTTNVATEIKPSKMMKEQKGTTPSTPESSPRGY